MIGPEKGAGLRVNGLKADQKDVERGGGRIGEEGDWGRRGRWGRGAEEEGDGERGEKEAE